MSEADKMLEELGYIKVNYLVQSSILLKNNICYEKSGGIAYLILNKEEHKFRKESENGFSYNITMQELKAINKKCSELGWL